MDWIEWSRNGLDGSDRMKQEWTGWVGQNGVGMDRMDQIESSRNGSDGLDRKQQE